jgi:beta-glucosidase
VDFLWGAATSAYQVEGGHTRADWVGAGDACAHDRLYPADLDALAGLGLNAYRFSVEWSSIEPQRGQFDSDWLDHYAAMVRACRARAISPVVTLWHFTLPRWFAARGGWLHPEAVPDFVRFAAHVAAALPAPEAWISLNEPNVYALLGYVAGLWPPHQKRPDVALRILSRLKAAHRAVLPALRATGAPVGIAHHYAAMASASPLSLAPVADTLFNHAFLREPADFLGLNYYTRFHWAGFQMLKPEGPTQMGWEIYPEGLEEAIRVYSHRKLPIMITENGIATEDDTLRASFIAQHIAALQRAKADVRGYFYWSLLDNFEWAEGFRPRFGLIGVNHATQERGVRASAHAYAQIVLKASKGERQRRQ